MNIIGVINSTMIGTPIEPHEGVDWSEPDFFFEHEFEELVEMTVECFASISPHMIVFEVEKE